MKVKSQLIPGVSEILLPFAKQANVKSEVLVGEGNTF